VLYCPLVVVDFKKLCGEFVPYSSSVHVMYVPSRSFRCIGRLGASSRPSRPSRLFRPSRCIVSIVSIVSTVLMSRSYRSSRSSQSSPLFRSSRSFQLPRSSRPSRSFGVYLDRLDRLNCFSSLHRFDRLGKAFASKQHSKAEQSHKQSSTADKSKAAFGRRLALSSTAILKSSQSRSPKTLPALL